MASTYEYLTLANLEKFTGIDYSTVNSTAFADANVEMIITTAEELINGLLGVSTAQTVTNAITISTKFLSAWLMNQNMEDLGYGTENTNPIYELSWKEIIELVKTFLNSDVGVDTIPMSGADRYYNATYRGYYY